MFHGNTEKTVRLDVIWSDGRFRVLMGNFADERNLPRPDDGESSTRQRQTGFRRARGVAGANSRTDGEAGLLVLC